jgi:hypothetical protein
MNKIKTYYLLFSALTLIACSKAINYEAPKINFVDNQVFQNFPDTIKFSSADSLKTDTILSLGIHVINGSFAIQSIVFTQQDYLVKKNTYNDSSLVIECKVEQAPYNLKALSESFDENIKFKLQRNHKYNWEFSVYDEKKHSSNTIKKTLLVK